MRELETLGNAHAHFRTNKHQPRDRIVYFTLNLFQKAVNERDEVLDTVRKSESVFMNYLLASFS